MSLLASLDPPPRPSDRRAARRRKLRLQAQGAIASGRTEVVILDLSEDGMLLKCEAELQVGERIDLVIPEAGAAEATIVWASGRYIGCRFDRPLSTAAVSAALLRSPGRGPEAERKRAVYTAMVELRAVGKVIERITDQVDRAIDRLKKRR